MMLLHILIKLLLAVVIGSPIIAGMQARSGRLTLRIYLQIFLLALSIGLYLFVLFVAVPYSCIKLIGKNQPRALTTYFFDAALANDMSGGVMGQHVFNDWWIHPDGVRFGKFGISISKILYLNKIQNSWYQFGVKFGQFLEWLDPKHLEESTR
ncbi:MAG: hypothetical protein GC192_23550 [Bacteroidetes bacterium]|nr:hypothetical protein [Bacteroidota bacterium]